MKFEKTHAYGNDFMSVNREDCVFLTPEIIQRWSNRKTGVGFDQLIVVEQSAPKTESVTISFYNSDGSRSGACGNGARCAARLFCDATGLKKFSILVTQSVGEPIILAAECLENGDIRLNMGKPKRAAPEIPLLSGGDPDCVTFSDLHHFEGMCVNVGNPHIVFLTPADYKISDTELRAFGSKIEVNRLFPERTNVEFIRKLGENHIQMRVWERGAGVTSACGTGACASAIVSILKKICDPAKPIRISADGGDLFVTLTADGEMILQGEAIKIYSGEIAA